MKTSVLIWSLTLLAAPAWAQSHETKPTTASTAAKPSERTTEKTTEKTAEKPAAEKPSTPKPASAESAADRILRRLDEAFPVKKPEPARDSHSRTSAPTAPGGHGTGTSASGEASKRLTLTWRLSLTWPKELTVPSVK